MRTEKDTTNRTQRSGKTQPDDEWGLSRQEQLVCECLQWTHASPNPNVALERLLAFVGERFGCHRTYIFEQNAGGKYDNTHEWCAPGVAAQKDLLQDESREGLDWWLDAFHQGDEVVIRDIEDIRADHPMTYAVLHAQSIRSLVAAGLWDDGKLLGFYGVDDPRPEELDRLPVFLRFTGYFVSAILRRRDLMERLEYMSFHDQLTGVWNRNVIQERAKRWETVGSMGVAYCDVTALKQINDHLGHHAGDEMICRSARLMIGVFGLEQVYRVGGDEFLALCPDVSREEFDALVRQLKDGAAKDEQLVAVGWAWTDQRPMNLSRVIAQADADMYESKRAYYGQIDPVSGERRDRRRTRAGWTERGARRQPARGMEARPGSPLDQYMRSNFFDGEALLKSIGAAGPACYLYFGDMQTGFFYITDNLRDTFGFEGNVVPDFINAWERRVSNQEDLELLRRDLRELRQDKKEKHDLWYRVRDRKGDNFWIHCRGLMLWDEARENPLFFSGCISSQEHDFVVDPVTNFPREYAALLKLNELQRAGAISMVAGFCLNHFSELNESWGRDAADELLRAVSVRLNEHFGHRVYFYRLDGLRFLAVASQAFRGDDRDLAESIREIVRQIYRERGILVRRPCSLSVLRQPDPDGQTTPQSILTTIMAMIDLIKQDPEREMVNSPSDEVRQQKRRADQVLELNRSVLNGFIGFRIVVQPIVSAAGDIVGGETLLRWSCRGEDVSPAEFIPMLEKNKLILPVGRWIFEQVVRTCQRIVACLPRFLLSFNVSYFQLADEELPNFMRQTLDRFGLDGSHLIMELTETHFDETPEKLERFVRRCKEMGMQVALDDFGSGYSALSLLLHYPADMVKLDRSLLGEITQSQDKIKFIRAIVYACHQFGKQVCMEGVETREELELIRSTHCDLIQGYCFHRPMELRDLYPMLLGQGGASPDAP